MASQVAERSVVGMGERLGTRGRGTCRAGGGRAAMNAREELRAAFEGYEQGILTKGG